MENIYKNKVNEGIGLDLAIVSLISTLSTIILVGIAFILGSEIDKKLSKKISEICGKEIIIRKLNGTVANALSFFNLIFVTSKCYELLSEKELIAVCLHEVGHKTSYDSLKMAGGTFYNSRDSFLYT